MEVKSYSAKTLRDALHLVQHELGPDAAVLQTREVWDGWLRGLMGKRRVEVMAARSLEWATVPDQLASDQPALIPAVSSPPEIHRDRRPDTHQSAVQEANDPSCGDASRPRQPCSPVLFQLFTDLVDAELGEDAARQLVNEVRLKCPDRLADVVQSRQAVRDLLAAEIHVQGPIQLNPGQRSVVALVGPTGVGKTTTIAKLAANFRLRDKKRVALITVDTYRIAAVEQLKTYAEIIDLPMQVVSTPSEMRTAIQQFTDYDLVLMDTAGRSPHDEVRIQELRAILAEAHADEVHLVLSTTSGARTLQRTAEKFAAAGTTALLLTKLDESPSLAEVWPVLRDSRMPVSYVTNGQNVPDDIQHARTAELIDAILNPVAAAA